MDRSISPNSHPEARYHAAEWRRCRRQAGYVWLGVQKETERGERSSGLAFDIIVNTEFQGTS
jgi:hypothetical protein